LRVAGSVGFEHVLTSTADGDVGRYGCESSVAVGTLRQTLLDELADDFGVGLAV
jgi:hypothetical protein